MQSQTSALAMFDIRKQRLGRGGGNAAYAQVESTGVHDAACRVHDLLVDELHGRSLEHGLLPRLDHLRPASLAGKICSQLAAIPALSDPGLNPDDQEARLATFLELRSRGGSDISREIAARTQDVLREATEHVSSSLLVAYAASPAAVRQAVQDLKAALDQMRAPDIDEKALVQWLALKKAADKFGQHRVTLPSMTVRTVEEAVTAQVRQLYDQCLKTLALSFALSAWQEYKTKLTRFLEELIKRIGELFNNLGSVKKALEAKRAAAAKDQHVSRASVVKALAGPNEDQVIAGLLGRTRAADENALARALLERFEPRLREICVQHCAWIGADQPLPELFRLIPPEIQAEAFSLLVAETTGPGQSLYEILEREGIESCVDFLYHRSEPTVDLSGRDMSQLGICLEHLCIVTLPQPVGPKDCKIRENVRAAFEKIEAAVTFADAPATDRSVTCVRFLIGWPIGLEAQNSNLLNHYQEADKHGHRPHLFGLLPDSPYGKAIDKYRALNTLATPVCQEDQHVRPDAE